MKAEPCPVCYYDGDPDFVPRDYHICGRCGIEFEYDDATLTHAELRAKWISNGSQWFDDDERKQFEAGRER